MKMKHTPYMLFPLVFFAFMALTATDSRAAGYDALKGVKAVKAVFDFRVGDPGLAASQLQFILDMLYDPSLTSMPQKPEIAVVFIGPAVALVSTDRQRFGPEAQGQLDAIANTVASMAKAGIKMSICLHAIQGMGVDPASILPGIKKVGNGWISVIGYQMKGYALVSNF